jgi:hypothetical protein
MNSDDIFMSNNDPNTKRLKLTLPIIDGDSVDEYLVDPNLSVSAMIEKVVMNICVNLI